MKVTSKQTQSTELRRQAEVKFSERRKKDAAHPATDSDTRRLVCELEVHQIELEMQNEELRRAQEELEESRAKYFDLYDLAPVGYLTLSEQGLILEANLTAAKLLGVEKGQLTKQPLSRFIVRDDQDVGYLQRRELFETGEPQSRELRVVKMDGAPSWVHVQASMTKNRAGAPECRVMLSDITARKQAEEALQETHDELELRVQERTIELAEANKALKTEITERKQAEENLEKIAHEWRTTFDAITDGVLLLDQERRILRCNRAFADLLGQQAADLVGRKCHEVVHGNPIPDEDCPFVKARDSGRREVSELRVGDRIFSVVTDPVVGADGQVTDAVHIMTDTTERRRAEAERGKLQAQLTQAQKMESVGRLAGGVAHDFNNILVVIIGRAEMAMMRLGPSDPLRASLEEIHKAAWRSADLTRQLLAFARKQIVAPKVLDLNNTVSGMLRMLQRLIGEDIELTWTPGPALWPVRIDPSQVDQILANLAVNARDAIAGTGRVMLETQNATLDEAYCSSHAGAVPGGYVLLAVSDDGCGMDPATVSQIFEPFFTTKGVGRGTGLGLATVYGIVKQNNGFIDVYSETGKGATFKIYLPQFLGEAVKTEAECAAEVPGGRGETVLLVEDDAETLSMGQAMLETLGYSVVTAGTPEAAIRRAQDRTAQIHLLITDVVMPGMNGRELAARIEALQGEIRCLFMSGYTSNIIVHSSGLDEGTRLLQKPFSLRDLASKVREALDQEQE